ncbi:S-layer homology domain-containing protein [Ferviditalea candida]|uniref:S-layer homology domain-containing protein n=1 Tax=Ferviditalea candida TaxID=3108399 RepID=A0ABU5ZLF8_9BACL|nr:S-layer homology domain-containing protein [Paenibacillaceae bacterium T2]
MKRTYRKWTSLLLIGFILLTMLPPMSVFAAGSRITITSLYIANSIVNGKPAASEDNNIVRYTNNPISVTANIEGISDAQVSSIYYEVTNVTTNTTVVEKNNKAVHQPGDFSITFNNVYLTDGLNKVVIKLGDSSVVESAPGWAYYTSTTNITDLRINGVAFNDNQFYPSDPAQSTTLSISGKAPNATQVNAYLLGDSTAKTAYFSNGDFFFIADDINKTNSTANFKLKPGDNQITFVAENNNKNYQIQKNLIYDNGKPFAFDATINDGTVSGDQKLITTPTVTKPNVTIKSKVKVDLNAVGDPQYRYVDVTIAGQKYGPYDLSGAKPAVRANNFYPLTINQGYSDTLVAVQGTALNDSISLTYADKAGNVGPDLSAPHTSTDQTVQLYELPAGALTAANAPYKFTVKNGTTILNEFTIQVIDPGTTLPVVDAAATESNFKSGANNKLKQGYNPTDPANSVAVQFSSAVADGTKVRVDVANLTGQNVFGTAYGSGTNVSSVPFTMPAGLAQGQYKLKIYYDGVLLSERYFEIDPGAAPTPTVTPYTSPLAVSDLTGVSGVTSVPTYFVVKGTNLGTDVGNITSAQLINAVNPADTVNLIPFDALNDKVIFKLSDQSALTDGAIYNLSFNVGATNLSFANAVSSDHKVVGADYGGDFVTDISPLQMTRTEVQTSTPITMTGGAFVSGKLLVEIMDLNGNPLPNANVLSVSSDQKTAQIALPSSLTTGDYLLRISSINNPNSTIDVLGQFPISVIDPLMTGINPTVKSVSASTPTEITVTGTNLGRYIAGVTPASSLKLQFTSVSNTSVPVQQMPVKKILAGSTATFDLPSLPEGSYKVELMYGGAVVGSALNYTVTSPPASLQENAALSLTNRYKVYDFSANLTIPTDKYQLVEYRFYNFSTDNNPPTTFAFNYVDPNLPYIDHFSRITNASDPLDPGVMLNEAGSNEINEQPSDFYVYADTNTLKVNAYLGNYDSNTVPYKTLTTPDTITVGGVPKYHRFKLTLDGLQNADTTITFIPSSDSSTVVARSGENPSGKKTYSISITSTPYVIINNLYNGMVVKDPVSEITCSVGGAIKGKCISGRLVNVPTSEFEKVEVYINDNKTTLLNSDFTSPLTDGIFNLQLGVARSSGVIDFDTKDGKNTVKFMLYRNGQLVSTSTYEIFVFRQAVPQILSVKPVETTDVIKYVPANVPDSYVTTEDTVSFSGQFANATEIKLTAHLVDDQGNPVVKYDRRYNNFASQEPIVGNPGYFRTVNSPQGMFSTNSISLNPTGDTVFEFTVTNASGITVTKTITVTREPEPYKIIYPIIVKNVKGVDQAFINSNFVEIEMAAENADSVKFGKQEAAKREVVDSSGLKKTHYFYEVQNLKPGTNNVQFTVTSGKVTTKGKVVIFNANTPIEGATYKTPMKSKLKVFDGLVEVSFPKGTNFMRNDPTAINQYLTADRQILFGIANKDDGRVDKYKHPAASDGQIGNPNPLISSDARLLLTEPTGRFRQAGPLIWVDAGTIAKNETDLDKAYNGSGRLPYDNSTFYNRTAEDLVVPTNRGQITLKYDPNIRNDAWRYLTVYHFEISEDSTGVVRPRWKNLGGVVDYKNNTITVPLDTFGYYQVMYMSQSFDDITAHPWARNMLDTLYAKGMMVPKAPPTSFVPNDPISRGEFVTMLVKIFDLPLNYQGSPTFTDVLRVNPLANGLYDYKYIETAARAGIVRGFGGGRFMPDSSITRQDAAVMISKAGNLKLNTNDTKVLQNLQKLFTDANSIDIYAQPAVEAITKAGLISGKENVLLQGQTKKTYRYDPLTTFTRAEAASVAINVLKQQKKIPK